MPEPPARPEPPAEALLRDLRELFRERGVDRLPTGEIVAALGARLGRPITAHRLARTLGPHGVGPRQYRVSGQRVRGYLLEDLAESRDAAPPPAESCGSDLPGESRDAEDRAGDEPRDPGAEWATHVAMHAARW